MLHHAAINAVTIILQAGIQRFTIKQISILLLDLRNND